jgi:hypothetical protein
MRDYTAEMRHTHGLEMRIRAGLNSGEVLVRAIGNDLHMDYSAGRHRSLAKGYATTAVRLIDTLIARQAEQERERE